MHLVPPHTSHEHTQTFSVLRTTCGVYCRARGSSCPVHLFYIRAFISVYLHTFACFCVILLNFLSVSFSSILLRVLDTFSTSLCMNSIRLYYERVCASTTPKVCLKAWGTTWYLQRGFSQGFQSWAQKQPNSFSAVLSPMMMREPKPKKWAVFIRVSARVKIRLQSVRVIFDSQQSCWL